MKQSTKPQRKSHSKKVANPNTPIIDTKVNEYDVICPSCGRKEVLKTTLKLSKSVPKTCRGCGTRYKVDISKMYSRNLDKFMNWMDCGMRLM